MSDNSTCKILFNSPQSPIGRCYCPHYSGGTEAWRSYEAFSRTRQSQPRVWDSRCQKPGVSGHSGLASGAWARAATQGSVLRRARTGVMLCSAFLSFLILSKSPTFSFPPGPTDVLAGPGRAGHFQASVGGMGAAGSPLTPFFLLCPS